MATTTLPYLVTPGSIKTALEKIKAAATPDRVTGDFVNTKLQIKGGTGRALIPFLKKIGFVKSDGTPTNLYKRFRNQSTGGAAVAEAIKIGYKSLSDVNEYFYDLNDQELLALVIQVTGAEEGNSVAKLTLSTLKNLKAFADFEAKAGVAEKAPEDLGGSRISAPALQPAASGRLGFNLGYTINLNLPATSDQAVFNAIFKALKEHIFTKHE